MNDILIGKIISGGQLQGTLSAEEQLSGSFDLFVLPENLYDGAYSFTPTESQQTAPTYEKTLLNNITIYPIPPEYIVPTGTLEINSNGVEDVTQYAEAEVNVAPTLQEKTVTVASAGDTEITADGGYDGLSKATATVPEAEASAGYSADFADVFGTRRWVLFPEFTVDSDGWVSASTYWGTHTNFNAVPSGTTVTPTTSSQTIGGENYMMEDAVTVNPIPPEYIIPSGTLSITANANDIDVTNYAEVDVSVPAPTPTLQTITKSYTPTESAQSETITASSGYDAIEEVDISVGAISSTYIGSGITQRDSTDLSASGDTVSVPSGYYASNGSKAVASGTAGTPTATKGAVNNHAISVTPSVTNSAGYISGGTINGTAVSVSASELVSGTLSVTSSGTKDVTNYASASIPSGSATPASSITGTTATVSSPSSNKIMLTQTVSNTPQVSAGYISSGTAGNSSVSLTGACTTKGTTSYYASTSDQTIGSGTYITGTQTFKAVSQTNLSADNIKNGTTISISNGNGNIWSVTGTYSGGGGGGKNVQIAQSTTRASSSTYVKCCGDITVATTGTYDVYWTYFRTSTSGTWGSQLYIDDVAQGSAYSTFTNHVCNVHISNVSLTANQKVSVYARSRGSNYYGYIGQLTIIES